jgi:hypothetical protein
MESKKSYDLISEVYRIQEMMGLLIESDTYYDKILDLYSKVGLDSMKDDEIEYLKSGGESELPLRFKSEISQKKYDDYVSQGDLNNNNFSTENWQDIFDLKNIIQDSNYKPKIRYDYDSAGFYLTILCNLEFDYDEEILDSLKRLNNQFSLQVENNKILYTIPKTWLEHL